MADHITGPPVREVPTDWGVLQATCRHPHSVVFTTRRPKSQGHLVINRVAYVSAVTLHCGPAPEDRSVEWLDRVWYLDRREGGYELRRPNGDRATESAREVLRDQVVPALHEWVQGNQVATLLVEGDAYWRDKCHQTIDAVELELATAAVRLHRIRTLLHRGAVISAREEGYITTLRVVSR